MTEREAEIIIKSLTEKIVNLEDELRATVEKRDAYRRDWKGATEAVDRLIDRVNALTPLYDVCKGILDNERNRDRESMIITQAQLTALCLVVDTAKSAIV